MAIIIQKVWEIHCEACGQTWITNTKAEAQERQRDHKKAGSAVYLNGSPMCRNGELILS